MSECQKDPTCGVFLKRGLFKDILWVSHGCTTSRPIYYVSWWPVNTEFTQFSFRSKFINFFVDQMCIVWLYINTRRTTSSPDAAPWGTRLQALRYPTQKCDLRTDRTDSLEQPFRCLPHPLLVGEKSVTTISWISHLTPARSQALKHSPCILFSWSCIT